MAYGYKVFAISFESEQRNIGSTVTTLLNQYVDIDAGDLKVDNQRVVMRIALSAPLDAILAMCDEIKKELEETSDNRILYTVSIVS
jgi:hypothetical protein